MCKIISVISCKGGVGKTTSAVNISSYMQMQGKKVCAVDLDPQHNLSKHFGIHSGHLVERPTIYNLLNAAIEDTEDDMEKLVKESIIHSTTVDVIPSTAKLSALETVIPTAICRERLLEYIYCVRHLLRQRGRRQPHHFPRHLLYPGRTQPFPYKEKGGIRR